MPQTLCEMDKPSMLFSAVSEAFPDVTITPVPRKYFNETRGMLKH